jgi:hypothetical protein
LLSFEGFDSRRQALWFAQSIPVEADRIFRSPAWIHRVLAGAQNMHYRA